MEEVAAHEARHFMGAGDHYTVSGKSTAGYDLGNIMSSAKGGKVEEKNIKEILRHHFPRRAVD